MRFTREGRQTRIKADGYRDHPRRYLGGCPVCTYPQLIAHQPQICWRLILISTPPRSPRYSCFAIQNGLPYCMVRCFLPPSPPSPSNTAHLPQIEGLEKENKANSEQLAQEQAAVMELRRRVDVAEPLVEELRTKVGCLYLPHPRCQGLA